ncbi:FmdB family zinc ribbon protein [Actinokineospora cianjurensis]|uniref:Putative FmdB family regulatory protein n=1 Tax=Actinokineospora cianjurensis TaxID=585224 RepID=A0A421B5E5_9PSEU|nr:FmdB family zinc ribbon protein [Actinokineospora cianjurensis]RLK59574.1 putative FmdB family regulatory protein [Actinokineospora cianjurensis]
MPTYQYACTACEHRFEAVQSFTDSALSECPECTGRLRKLYGSVGVVFKGSGFYRNDSRSGSSSGSTPAAAATAKTESTTKSEPKTESKSKSDSSTGSTAPAAAKPDSTAAKAS